MYGNSWLCTLFCEGPRTEPCLHPRSPAFSLPLEVKQKQNKVKGHKTSVSETQNWETNGYTWILPFVFATTGDTIGYCGKE